MLQINYKKGKYELKGSLILESSKSLLSYFKSQIKKDSKVMISLKDLNHIDNTGIEALNKLGKIAHENNTVFKVLGKVNEKISWILNEPKIHEILKE